MSAREGFIASEFAPCPRPPWGHPELPDPRSQIQRITVEVREHWPFWASEDEVRAALARAYEKASAEIDRRFQ